MAFNPEEKQMIKEALSLYVQLASQQYPPQQVEGLAKVIRGIVTKLETVQVDGEEGAVKPAGISDEWYEAVCTTCEKLSFDGCGDPITSKFPGKCDPILKYERVKMLASK